MTEFKAPPPPPETFNVPTHSDAAPAVNEPVHENVQEAAPVEPQTTPVEAAPVPEPMPEVTPEPVEKPVAPVEQPAAAPVTEEVSPVHEEPSVEQSVQTPEQTTSTENSAQPDEKVSPIKQMMQRLTPAQRQGLLAVISVVFGMIFGAVIFGGSNADPTPVVQGLQGIVSNPDIKTPLKRCGQVEASAACVLYIMNSLPYEKLAKDFFDSATAVTGRSTTIIGWDNVRYGGLKIPPGYFAQIKIPARQ